MAVYEEQEAQQTAVANSRLTPSPDLHQAELSVFQPTTRGEIEVNSSALKSGKRVFVLVFVRPAVKYWTLFFLCSETERRFNIKSVTKRLS